MSGEDWLETPGPVMLAYDFVVTIQEHKLKGLKIDGEAGMASIAAAQVLRRYFQQIEAHVNEGCFEPDRILEIEALLERERINADEEDDEGG